MNNEIPINKNLKNSLNGNKNTNIVDSLSEVIKFKTELYHSWELSGNCKYGENVIKYIYFNIIYFFIILQCVFAHGVFDLRNSIKEEKNCHIRQSYVNNFFVADIVHMERDANLAIKKSEYLIYIY